MLQVIAELTGDIGKSMVQTCTCLATAIGVACIGVKAVDVVGRNPGAAGSVLTQSILGMALTEAIALYAFFFY